MNRFLWHIFFLGFLLLASCQKDPSAGDDLLNIPYNPQAFVVEGIPYFFPPLPVPADNPLTVEGVELGRFLFYDPILSADQSISCASCHRQELAFTDGRAFSEGIKGGQTARNSMSLANVAFFGNGLFWDGRVQTLEEQSLHPIEDPKEMGNSLPQVLERLRQHPQYPERFRKAFGIAGRMEISEDLLAKAIAQFERTLVSSEAKYDYANWDRGADTRFFSPAELRGKNLFSLEPLDPFEPHPGCAHCHNNTALVTTNEYLNNGLDEIDELSQFPDPGRGGVTGKLIDYGKFRVPSLRNVDLTAPYMHDGRFQSLEEVLDHYASGGHYSYNVDANIQPFSLSQQDKEDLIAFMKSMTDSLFLTNPAFSDPF